MVESVGSSLKKVDWSEYHEKIEKLAVQVYSSGWEFDQILCIAKGGLRVGDILCRLFNKPLAILSASSYGGENNNIRGKITFSQHISMTTSHLGSKVLLVDDLADSGASLQATLEWLQDHFGEDIEEIRTAVIWYKGTSEIKPNYYVEYLPHSPWIHQPFEVYEEKNLEELANRYSSLM